MVVQRTADALHVVADRPVQPKVAVALPRSTGNVVKALPPRVAFPSTAHILAVEKAAVDFVWQYFEVHRYIVTDRQKEGVGYDLDAVRGQTKLILEVKGTSGSTRYAYITANELAKARGASSRDWRMCMITMRLPSRSSRY